VVNTSPEPVSNALMSCGEDVATVGLLYVAYEYPTVAAGVAAVLLVIVVGMLWMAQRIVKRVFFRTRKAES
jgi:hypothetical protein